MGSGVWRLGSRLEWGRDRTGRMEKEAVEDEEEKEDEDDPKLVEGPSAVRKI